MMKLKKLESLKTINVIIMMDSDVNIKYHIILRISLGVSTNTSNLMKEEDLRDEERKA